MISSGDNSSGATIRRLVVGLCAVLALLASTGVAAQTMVVDQTETTQDSQVETPDDDRDSSEEETPSEDGAEEKPGEASTEPDADASASGPKTDAGDEYFGQAHRRQMYRDSKLSPTKALLYTLAFPGVGNVYAEQYFLAGLEFSLMAFTTMFVLYGLTTQQPQFLHMGFVTGGVAYTSGALTSYFGVKKYNRRLREGFNLRESSSVSDTPFDVPRARTIGVSVRF